MMRRLTVIMFALAAYCVPANAASLSTFAYDVAGWHLAVQLLQAHADPFI